MKIEHVENSCLQVFADRCLHWLCCFRRDTFYEATTSIAVNTAMPIKDTANTVINTVTSTIAVNTASNRKTNFIKSLENKQFIYDQLCEVNIGCWSQEDIQEAVSSCSDYTSALLYLSQEHPVHYQTTYPQKTKQEIYEQLCSMNKGCWNLEDIEDAVSSCPDYTSALQYLSHECPLCCDQYPYSRIVKMTHCNCSLCEQCFIRHFSSVIKEKSIIDVVCPICKKPNLEKSGNSDESMEYFNLLDTQIHHYLDQATHDLFQRKLRDRALMKMPEFSWCSHCPFGVLNERNTLKVICPTCKKSTCFNCKQQWEDIHETMSCEEFKAWKLQKQELDVFLYKNGIECPSCKFQYELWKGGCLHFKCTQCQCEFCGGCKQIFYQGEDCDFSEECQGKGLHAHHTRDCFYYLRDWSTERLQKLLQQNGIQYESDSSENSVNSIQGILKKNIQKSCDKLENTEDNGDSNIADKEFLVQLINANSLDPADLYTEQEMKIELHRWKLSVPDHSRDDNNESYLETLKMKIKQDIPLLL